MLALPRRLLKDVHTGLKSAPVNVFFFLLSHLLGFFISLLELNGFYGAMLFDF